MPKLPGHKRRPRPDCKQTRPGITALLALIMLPAISFLAGPGVDAQTTTSGHGAADQARIAPRAVTLSLYFADHTRFALLAEQRQLPQPDNPVALGKTIVRELAAGPRNQNLVRTLPDGKILRALFIAADKTAYVDLDHDMWPRHPGGVQADMLAIYSIVNSLVLNMAEIDAVKILSRGREPIPAAGHLDLRYPLKANILLIR